MTKLNGMSDSSLRIARTQSLAIVLRDPFADPPGSFNIRLYTGKFPRCRNVSFPRDRHSESEAYSEYRSNGGHSAMNIRIFRNYLFLMVLLTVCTTDVFGQTCPVGMQGSLSKTLYEVDEPIDLALTFENQGHTERRVLISSPALSAASTNLVSLLSLTPTGVLKQAPRDGVTTSMSMTGRRISGGGKATVRVYLQRYLDGLVPGHYEIPGSSKPAV